jgi:hypothetical protein
MGYRAMQLACHCGQTPDRILEVGFTSDRNMVVHYWCAACKRVLFYSQPLEECAQACPPPDVDAEIRSSEEDARFLQSLGISVGE